MKIFDFGKSKKINTPYNFEYSSKITNKKRFENIMAFAMSLERKEEIFWLIKILCEQITLSNVMNLVSKEKGSIDNKIRCINIDEKVDKKYDLSDRIYGDTVYVKDFPSFKIDLGKDPVITKVWKKKSLSDVISLIGNENNEWKQDRLNHMGILYYPIGVLYIYIMVFILLLVELLKI